MKLPCNEGSFCIYADKTSKRSNEASLLRRGELEYVCVQSAIKRIQIFSKNMIHIMHALLQGLNALHNGNGLYIDLHAGNFLLKFFGNKYCWIGIIDWGKALNILETPRKEFKDI